MESVLPNHCAYILYVCPLVLLGVTIVRHCSVEKCAPPYTRCRCAIALTTADCLVLSSCVHRIPCQGHSSEWNNEALLTQFN